VLRITLPAVEEWDERTESFVYSAEMTLQLEHSLVSLSKWESKWHKPFLHTTGMTDEESLDYIRCMTLTQNVPPETYYRLTGEHIKAIKSYINEPMTATTFSKETGGKRNREIITAEIIYYWMSALQIPFECQKWHLNRLLAFIRVCSTKNAPAKKMSKKDIMSQNAALNAARRQKFNSKG
jgi:hypothetical protein